MERNGLLKSSVAIFAALMVRAISFGVAWAQKKAEIRKECLSTLTIATTVPNLSLAIASTSFAYIVNRYVKVDTPARTTGVTEATNLFLSEEHQLCDVTNTDVHSAMNGIEG